VNRNALYGLLIALVIAATGPAGAAAGDSIADFYAGKTITITVGSSPGGGYGVDARAVARNIGRHIPGAPTVIVQNMPGARGLAAANYLFNLAPKDGTFMGIVEKEHLIDSYLMPNGALRRKEVQLDRQHRLRARDHTRVAYCAAKEGRRRPRGGIHRGRGQ
jgi:tripartite-type tricarboxylate transporter receptor subunit TctC